VRDCHGHLADRPRGQAGAREPLPGDAAVARRGTGRSRAPARASPRVDLELPHAREEDARVVRVPSRCRSSPCSRRRRASSPRSCRRPSCGRRRGRAGDRTRAQGAGEDDVGVLWVDDEAWNAAGLVEPHERPRLGRVGRLVDAWPSEMWLRILPSPVPAQTMLGSETETARAPIDWTGWSSNIGCQFTPPVGRLVDAAGGGADVVRGGIARDTGRCGESGCLRGRCNASSACCRCRAMGARPVGRSRRERA